MTIVQPCRNQIAVNIPVSHIQHPHHFYQLAYWYWNLVLAKCLVTLNFHLLKYFLLLLLDQAKIHKLYSMTTVQLVSFELQFLPDMLFHLSLVTLEVSPGAVCTVHLRNYTIHPKCKWLAFLCVEDILTVEYAVQSVLHQ